METLFIFWTMGVVIYFAWNFWQRGVDLSETRGRVAVAESQANVTQTVLNEAYDTNTKLRGQIKDLENSRDYWFNSYIQDRDVVAAIESYIYDNDLEQTPSGKHILNIIHGEENE